MKIVTAVLFLLRREDLRKFFLLFERFQRWIPGCVRCNYVQIQKSFDISDKKKAPAYHHTPDLSAETGYAGYPR